MRIARITIALVATAAAGLLLAGCSSTVDHSQSGSTAPPISQGIGTDPTTAPTAPHTFPVMPGSPSQIVPAQATGDVIDLAAPSAITVTAEARAPVTVTAAAPPAAAPVTVTAAALPAVTVTAPAAPAAPANAASTDPSGPKRNGSYIVGSQITPGNWQCTTPGPETIGASWTTYDSAHTLLDIDLTSIASISDADYSVTFDFCASTWTLVG